MPQVPQYGYIKPIKPLQAPGGTSLAAAAAKDPYGLAPNNRSGPLGIGSSTGFAAPPALAAAPKGYTQTQVATSLQANPYASAGGYTGAPMPPQVPTTPTTATATSPYDVNTDPNLQQIRALVGLSDEQAQSEALKERQNLVLAYGDKSVAQSVLGADDPIAAAAAANPTSTVSQLGHQRDTNLKSLLDALNSDNLGYSGYRVTQEQQAQTDYQNALAQAASGLNSSLDSVTGNLNQALSTNQGQLTSALSAAAAAHANDTTDPGAGSSTPDTPPVPPPGDTGDQGARTPNTGSFAQDPATLAAIYAKTQKNAAQPNDQLARLLRGATLG